MALINKLTTIADAIREKTKKSDLLTLDQMADEIRNLSSESLLKPGDYPDYIRKEINRVADEVRNVLQDNSIVSICLSDSHYPSDTYTSSSALHAAMAVKGLTYLIPVDFIAHLGDVGYEGGDGVTTVVPLKNNIIEMLKYLNEVDGDSIPLFVAIGNHDSAAYVTPSDNNDIIDGQFLYDNLTTLCDSKDENTVFAGDSNGGYCYRDFPEKKLRIFLLNTIEGILNGGKDNDIGTSEIQRAWVADALLNLNAKENPEEWSFIVLSHYPLDFGASKTLSNVFEAYVNGSSITLNSTTYSFTGNNYAKFIVQFHGHLHNYLVDKIYGGPLGNRVNGNPSNQYNAYRMAIPNSQHARENYYINGDEASTDGTLWGIKFFEGTFESGGKDVYYSKIPGTTKDTSFVINVINPTEQLVYSFYYGVGRNRVISYADEIYYSVTQHLTNVTISNPTLVVKGGASYEANLVLPNNEYTFSKVIITMGDEDVTADVYSAGVIFIEKITGDITITAIADTRPTSNLYMFAYDFETDSSNIYNEIGYKDNHRLSSYQKVENGPSFITWAYQPGYVVTGCIPWNKADSITISGAHLDTSDKYCRFWLVKDTRGTGGDDIGWWLAGGSENTFPNYFTVEELEVGNKYKLTPLKAYSNSYNYFTMSLKGSGKDLIITFNDAEVTYDYKITYDLANVILSNPLTHIPLGDMYSTIIYPLDGYEIKTVSIIMGGVDITNTAYQDNRITIDSVVGDIQIKIIAKSIDYLFTNQIPLATITLNGSEIYNDPLGYKINTRLNSSGNEVAANMCTTGYIKLTGSSDDIVRIKNVTIQPIDGNAPYLIFYNKNGAISGSSTNTVTGINTLISGGQGVNMYITIEDDMIIAQPQSAGMMAMRLSVASITSNSIITVNEEIV